VFYESFDNSNHWIRPRTEEAKDNMLNDIVNAYCVKIMNDNGSQFSRDSIQNIALGIVRKSLNISNYSPISKFLPA
jgi:hypothetical protein